MHNNILPSSSSLLSSSWSSSLHTSFFSNIGFIFNIILWYAFTVLSTIYSKQYLNLGSLDAAHTLTLVSFAYPAFFKLFKIPTLNEIGKLLSYEYVSLALFNIGTTLLTNIGMAQTSVSLTYMVKVNRDFH